MRTKTKAMAAVLLLALSACQTEDPPPKVTSGADASVLDHEAYPLDAKMDQPPPVDVLAELGNSDIAVPLPDAIEYIDAQPDLREDLTPDILACPNIEDQETACGNGCDDDGNGLTDCADPNCEGNPCGEELTCQAGSCRGEAGTLAWAKHIEGAIRGSVAILPDGDAIVAGSFWKSILLGEGEANETLLERYRQHQSDSSTIFIARYHPNGTLAWAKRAGGDSEEWGRVASVWPDGSFLITGSFDYGGMILGEGELGETVLELSGQGGYMCDDNIYCPYYNLFLAKYRGDGTLDWARTVNSWTDSWPEGEAALPDGDTLLIGTYDERTILGEGEPQETTFEGGGRFLARYKHDGTLACATDVGSGGVNFEVIGLAPDEDILATGGFSEEETFGGGRDDPITLTSTSNDGRDIFIARFATDGTVRWAKRAGGADSDEGQGLSPLPDGGLLVTGRISGDGRGSTVTFGEGEPNKTTLTPKNNDIFIARYNADGTLAWAKGAGGWEHDYGWAVASLPGDRSMVTGAFQAEACFGLGEPGETCLVGDDEEPTFFLALYEADGSLAWAKAAYGDGWSEGNSLAAQPDGGVWVAGKICGTVILGEGEAAETVIDYPDCRTEEGGNSELFIARYW